MSSDKKPQGESLIELETLRARVAELERAQAAHERAVEELKESEQRFELAIRGTSDGVWHWDLVTGNEWWSARYRELTGYTDDELPASYESWESILHPDDRERTLEGVRLEFEEDRTHGIEFRLRTKHHGYRWFLARGAIARDETGRPVRMAGSIQDIDERKQAEESLMAAKQQLEHLLEASPAAIYRRQPGGNYPATFISDNVERQLGYESHEFTDDPQFWASHIHPDDAPRVMANLSDLLEKDHHVHEYRFLHKDGTYRWMHDESRLVHDAGGNPLDVIGSWIDITERRRIEEERRALEAELRQAQKMEAVGRLAGGIAHDFNNLLQAILGYTEMALSRVKTDDPLYEDLSEVRESSERAATLTRQLLAFSRRQILQTKDIDVNSLVENLLRLARRLLGANIEITSEFAPRPIVVHADPAQLEQVVLNLCVNARDAMPDGGRLILSTSIRTANELRQDGLSPEGRGNYAELTVEDTGCGIPPEARDHLFEPFFTTKEEGRGTGLGLAMVYGIVRQHQGMIDVQTDESGGSVFRIHLPAVERPAESVSIRSEGEVRGGDECLLVAEDDRQVRRLTARVLSASGYRVLACEDGREALKLFEAHEDEIKLAVLDLVMPQAGGQRVAEEIRRRRPDLPIVFCTGYDVSGAKHGLDLDARTVLIPKPYRESELLRAVREVLDA
jgi:PAS domain S-box-containing protein